MSEHHAEPAQKGARAPSRGTVAGTCEHCHKPFRGRRDKRHCTGACRAAASRERKAAELADLAGRLQQLIGG